MANKMSTPVTIIKDSVTVLTAMVFIIVVARAQSQSAIILESSISRNDEGDHYACSGEKIEIKCTTEGSVQTWESDEYIGNSPGHQLELLYGVNFPGTRVHIEYSNSFVEVLNNTNNDTKLTSVFHIIASTKYPNPQSVTCHNTAHGNINQTISFRVIADPGVVQILTAIQVVNTLNHFESAACILIIKWSPLATEINIFTYKLTVNSTKSAERRHSSTEAAFNVVCGTQSVQIHAENRCNHSGPKSTEVVANILSVDELVPLVDSTNSSASTFTLNLGMVMILSHFVYTVLMYTV